MEYKKRLVCANIFMVSLYKLIKWKARLKENQEKQSPGAVRGDEGK